MNEEAGTATLPAPAPEPAPAPKPKRTWRQAFDLVWNNKKATMLPLVVTQVPSGVALGAVYLYLHLGPYSEANVSVGGLIATDAPSALLLWMLIATAVHSLFAFIGGTAAVVSAKSVIDRKPARLSQALDPAFTRMGGVLILCVVFNVLFAATSVGVILLIYFLVRWGLAFHAFILDGASPLGSLGQSWGLLRGRMLRFTGVLLSTIPVILGVLFVFLVVLVIITAPIGAEPGRDATVALNAIVLGSAAMFGVPITAYLAAATTLFYLSVKEESRA